MWDLIHNREVLELLYKEQTKDLILLEIFLSVKIPS